VGEAGTEHIQGYVRLKARLRIGQVTKMFPRGHVSPARGTEEENRTYCSKDREASGSDWGEHGIYDEKQGKVGRRTDLTQAVQMLKTEGIQKVADEMPETFVKFHQGLLRLQEMLTPKPPTTRDVTTVIMWGEPGTGKTWRATNKYPEAYKVRAGRDPFGDYKNEEVIIFDEFNYELWPIELMNELCDIYRIRLDCRYQNKWAYWTKVIVISNVYPGFWWQFAPEVKKAAFMRRVVNVYEIINKEQSIDF